MDKSVPLQGMIRRSSSLALLLFLSGCSLLAPEPEPAPPIAEPVPAPQPVPEPVIEPPPVVVVEPEPEPEPEPPPPPVQQPIASMVAIVLSDRAPAYANVAAALDEYLEEYEIYDLSDQSLSAKDAFAQIADANAKGIIAIGLAAAKAAKRFATAPVVFSQVFNVAEADLAGDRIKGVSVLPPMSSQISNWRRLDPSIRNVGAILGNGHEDLIAETEAALLDHGVKFHYAVANSDRETLYLFNRMIRDLDGYILFPDNRVLSRTVLDEMMSYASRHRVQVAVFNQSLLNHGAIFSASPVPADIAETIAGVLESMITGEPADVPSLTALSAIEIEENDAIVNRFGLRDERSHASVSVAETQ